MSVINHRRKNWQLLQKKKRKEGRSWRYPAWGTAMWACRPTEAALCPWLWDPSALWCHCYCCSWWVIYLFAFVFLLSCSPRNRCGCFSLLIILCLRIILIYVHNDSKQIHCLQQWSMCFDAIVLVKLLFFFKLFKTALLHPMWVYCYSAQLYCTYTLKFPQILLFCK